MKKLILYCFCFTFAFTAKSNTSEKPFLGVSTSTVSDALKAQLSLNKALVVIHVLPNSPAAQAGMKIHDIILSFDGVPLDKTSSLVKLIASHKPGDNVELTLIRKTKKIKQKVVLLERPNSFIVLDEEELPSEESALVQLHRRMNELSKRGFSSNKATLDELHRHLFDITKRKGHQSPIAQKKMFSFKGTSSSVINSSDGIHDIRIETIDGNKKVKVIDKKSGDIVFDGALNTESEKKAIPESVRQKVIKLDSSVNILNKPPFKER